jgi:hypothetical protein
LQWQLSNARATPAHAVLARRELALIAASHAFEARLQQWGADVEGTPVVVDRLRFEEALREQPPGRVARGKAYRFLETGTRVRVVASSMRSSELPVLLGFGRFNWCPPAEEHAAILADWSTRVGARPVFMSHDTLELEVMRPPAAHDDAVDLAWQLRCYCTDLGGFTTALDQVRTGVWSFWWD